MGKTGMGDRDCRIIITHLLQFPGMDTPLSTGESPVPRLLPASSESNLDMSDNHNGNALQPDGQELNRHCNDAFESKLQ